MVHPKKKPVFSFQDARRMAQTHGFVNKEEYHAYDCPGAYKLPKDPDVVWSSEWKGWKDFLGVPWSFEEAKRMIRPLSLQDESAYLEFLKCEGSSIHNIDENDIKRLPYQPDLYYKEEWKGWQDFLGSG